MSDEPRDSVPTSDGSPTPAESPASTPAATPETPATTESDRIARLRARQVSVPTEQPASQPPVMQSAPPAAQEPDPAPQASTDEPLAAAGQGRADEPPPRFATPARFAAPAPSPTAPAPVDGQTTAPSREPAPPVAPYDTPAGSDESPAASRDTFRRSPGSPRTVAAVATAVVAATATALAGVVTSHVSSDNGVEHTRTEVVGAASTGVATILSYDYRHLDSDFANAERLLTPKFRKQYDDTTAKGVKPLAAKYKAISSADVSAAGIVEAGRDRAVVLVFVNQTVTNSQLTAPRLDRSRIDVTLVRSNGRWLIDKLTTL